ncbi:MAG TPA: chemotaxis protein CheX [Phycisphaerae bacterium]|jgi:hypothetical protein|nr:chemotaxis protein CheX [Phycisphaerae bacterium]
MSSPTLAQGSSRALAESLAETLESIAFVATDAFDDADLWTANHSPICRVLVPFKGARSGGITLYAPRALGDALVRTLFKSAPSGELPSAEDMLKELANTVAGVSLRKAFANAPQHVELCVPHLELIGRIPSCDEGARCGKAVLSVLGMPVFIAIHFGPHGTCACRQKRVAAFLGSQVGGASPGA